MKKESACPLDNVRGLLFLPRFSLWRGTGKPATASIN